MVRRGRSKRYCRFYRPGHINYRSRTCYCLWRDAVDRYLWYRVVGRLHSSVNWSIAWSMVLVCRLDFIACIPIVIVRIIYVSVLIVTLGQIRVKVILIWGVTPWLLSTRVTTRINMDQVCSSFFSC